MCLPKHQPPPMILMDPHKPTLRPLKLPQVSSYLLFVSDCVSYFVSFVSNVQKISNNKLNNFCSKQSLVIADLLNVLVNSSNTFFVSIFYWDVLELEAHRGKEKKDKDFNKNSKRNKNNNNKNSNIKKNTQINPTLLQTHIKHKWEENSFNPLLNGKKFQIR